MPVSVLTGATGGIGRWMALGLARAGYAVVLVARNRERGDELVQWLRARVGDAPIELLIADLSSLAAARQAGMLIDARHPEIDVLINNAGVFRTAREETEEGHELVTATNHLAPFVLTRTLVPALRAAASVRGHARIVNVGSTMSDRADIDPDNLELQRDWGMVRAYAQSKLALLMVTNRWAQRLAGTGVVANTVHPGAVATNIVRRGGVVGLAWSLMKPFLLNEEQGADTPLHVALSPEFAGITGAYVKRRIPVRPNRRALDAALLERVWTATEALADRS